MKTKLNNIKQTLLSVLALVSIMACNEEVKFDKVEKHSPVITSFSPTSGKAGTELSITGENLQYVKQVFIGGGVATLKYRINSTQMVVATNGQSQTGIITVSYASNEEGKDNTVESTGIFSVVYAIPKIENMPIEGKVNSEIYITGNNLEAVTDVIFGDKSGTIIHQAEKEMVVSVPFVESDNVPVQFAYFDGNNIVKVNAPSSFEIIKPQPVITIFPSMGETGNIIELEGENLTLIDKVLFGTTSATINDKTDTKISITIPAFEVTTTVSLSVSYYETKSITLTDNFQIVVPDAAKVLYWENKTIYAYDPSLTENFFNAETGEALTPCDLGDIANNKDVHFFAAYSGGFLVIVNPNAGANKLKSFSCDGTKLTATALPNIVKFKVFKEDNASQKKYIDLVKNKAIEEINLQMLMDDGVINPDALPNASSPKYNDPSGFTDGDIIGAFLFDSTGKSIVKVGFIEVIKGTVNGAKSSVQFNCYWQK